MIVVVVDRPDHDHDHETITMMNTTMAHNHDYDHHGMRKLAVRGGRDYDRAVDFVVPLVPQMLELVAGRGHYERVISAVLAAKRSVWIATANLKELMVEAPLQMPGRKRDYRSVLELLVPLAERGVELRILHAALPSRPFRDEFDRHPQLVRGGLELRMCPRVHLKTVIIDAELVYLGSANWTGAGLGAKGEGRRNFELGIVSQDEQLLDQVQALYDAIWRGEPCAGCKLRDECEAPLCDAAAAASARGESD